MRIGDRLRLNTRIILSVMGLMAIFLTWSFWELNKADRNERLVTEMQKTAYERVVLRDEYLMRKQERARVQWNAKTEGFQKILEEAKGRFTEPRDKRTLEGIQKNCDETVLIFSQLTGYREKTKADGHENKGFSEKERQLISYIIVNAYDLMNNIRILRESASQASNATHERSTFLVIFSLCFVVVLTIGNSIFINRILAKRTAELIEGTRIIGAGDLHHPIPVAGNDELAELAGTINEMAKKLQESYTSVENLEKEIAGRKHVEEALQRSEAQLRVILDATPFPIALVDTQDNNIDFWSHSALTLFGHTAPTAAQWYQIGISGSRLPA